MVRRDKSLQFHEAGDYCT